MSKSRPVKRLLYWMAAAAWTAVIFLTLPYAPIWRDWLTEKFTGYFIPIAVAVILILVLIITVTRMIKRRQPWQDFAYLVLITGAYVYSLSRIKILVEQVHFLEYGLLAYLIISALRVDRKDLSQYLNALLIVTMIGVADEFVQGVLINRVGELRDVYLNMLSGSLGLLWHRKCLNLPETPAEWQAGLKAALPIAGLIILSIGIFNVRISEFGHRIEDPEIGVFFSRLPTHKLTGAYPDSAFFKEEILPRLYRSSYAELLDIVKNPVHGEVLVHTFRRDKRLKCGDHIIGHRENQILEKYFSSYIAGSEHQWSAEFAAQVADSAANDLDDLYISPVSKHIITAYSSKQQWTVIALLETVVILLAIAVFLPRRKQ